MYMRLRTEQQYNQAQYYPQNLGEKPIMVHHSVSERILREMQELRYRLDEIEKNISTWKPAPTEVKEKELLSLPDHLRRTYLAAASMGQCDATQISNHTGRCRPIESNYLNQLTRTGWMVRRRTSRKVLFYPISPKTSISKNTENEKLPSKDKKMDNKPKTKKRTNQGASKTIHIEYLSADYDGTISPIKVARGESHIPLEIRVLLSQISRFIPISIITMKDLQFITSKTPFAHAWSAIGGLETQIGKRILKNELLESKLPLIFTALEYAKTEANDAGIEIEEKQDSKGQTVAFCVDWRRTKNQETAKQVANKITEFCNNLGLRILKYESQPFYDVYPISPDKGQALERMLSEMSIKKGVMYLGDSEVDNAAFNNPNVDVSIGVIHDESILGSLKCDYLLKFEDVPDFFKTLITENFQFSPSFPMIKTNPYKSPA